METSQGCAMRDTSRKEATSSLGSAQRLIAGTHMRGDPGAVEATLRA